MLITRIYFFIFGIIEKIPWSRILMDYLAWLYRIIFVKRVPKDILSNKEWIKEMNIPISWFYENKKKWLSGVARLKNAGDFLEICTLAFFDYVDEIILVAEESTDDTIQICERLTREYPDKVKYYFYPYKTALRQDGELARAGSNSVHSFAYFSNWAFSKATYSHVFRLDDDILPIPEVWTEMRQEILKKNNSNYNIYWGLNLIKKWEEIGVWGKVPYAGFWWDNGVWRVSPYFYFIQESNKAEILRFNWLYKRYWFGFLHLKLLKENYGMKNYIGSETHQDQVREIENSRIDNYSAYTNYPTEKINSILSVLKEKI